MVDSLQAKVWASSFFFILKPKWNLLQHAYNRWLRFTRRSEESARRRGVPSWRKLAMAGPEE